MATAKSGRRPALVRLRAVGVPIVLVLAVIAATVTPGSTASASLPPSHRPPTVYRAPAGADAAHPERALLIGDSMAFTLGWGLPVDAPDWGISVDSRGSVGCDLDPREHGQRDGRGLKSGTGLPAMVDHLG